MRTKIESGGVLQGITDLIKGLSGLVDKVFKNFDDGDTYVKVDTKSKRSVDVKEGVGKGEQMDLIVFGEKIGTVTLVPQEDGLYTLILEAKGMPSETIKDVKKDDIGTTQANWSMKYFRQTQKGARASRTLQVTLQRVNAGKRDEIRLIAINANYHIVTALDALDAVLDDDEFIEELLPEPTTFEISDSGESDELSVEVIDSCDSNECECLVSSCSTFLNNIKMMHWNSMGKGFRTLHTELDNWYWTGLSNLDFLGELCAELTGSSPNPGSSIYSDALLASHTEFDEDLGYDTIKSEMSNYITALETYYVNFEHDIQSELDTLIRYWRKERDYIVARFLK